LQRRELLFGVGGIALAAGFTALNKVLAAPGEIYDPYTPGPDSQPQSGVPKGKTFEFIFTESRIFPGTVRKITVYVPVQYRAEKPACVYVGLDGLWFEAPVVFDNLIHKREMPVTIAIGVASGEVSSLEPLKTTRSNRSFEFDGLNDNLARFLLKELLPEVSRRKTPDGLPILLSEDPNDRAAGGASTGGIGAFTLAWERPDAFRRVFTAIGTFVGMRGGDSYPVLVRKTEPKPIRIFMQDGSNDGLPGYLDDVGDWWMGNQAMQRALKFSGYQVEHIWGVGPHSTKHATAVFPDAMRWLWADWPRPVTTGESQNTFLQALLLPGEQWQTVSGDYQSMGAIAANPRGEIVFRDTATKTWVVTAEGRLHESPPLGDSCERLVFGADGRVYAAAEDRILAYTDVGRSSAMAQDIRARDLVVDQRGMLYAVDAGTGADHTGELWLVTPHGEKSMLDTGLNHPSGIALSPDRQWLVVAEGKTHWGYSYRVQADGSVRDKQRFYRFHVPDSAEDSGVTALTMDREGRLYAATRMGVQVLDSNGRVRAILPLAAGEVKGRAFGGEDFGALYVSCADGKLYRRKLKVTGARSSDPPMELPKASGS
jgi:sugar lactone lactonase YvrE